MCKVLIPAFCILSIIGQAQKKTDVEFARELLHRSGDAAISASPTISAASLLRIGVLSAERDKNEALQYIEAAIQIAAAIPPDETKQVGGNIGDKAAARLAEFDVKKGLELIARTPPGKRSTLLNTIVRGLLAEKNYPAVCEALQQYGFDHPPAYKLISNVLSNIPNDSEDRSLLFGRSVLALRSDPTIEFGVLLRENADGLSRTDFVESIHVYTQWLLSRTQEIGISQEIGVSTAKSDAVFGSDAELELFRMLPWIKKADSAIVDKVFAKYPNFKTLSDEYPGGLPSMTNKGGSVSFSSTRWRSDSVPNAAGSGGRGGGMSTQLAAIETAKSDASRAMTMASQLSSPKIRAETFSQIAAVLVTKDSGNAELAIEKCLLELKALDNSEERLRIIATLANAARGTGQVGVARDLIKRGLEDVAKVYKLDNNEKSINKAPRTVWPSYYYAQRLAHIAGQVFGTEADDLIRGLPDPELHLVASIEVAAALLNKAPPGSSGISINRVKR